MPKRTREEGKSEKVVKELPTQESLTVYCEGIPYQTTEEALMSFFSPCGKVVSIKAPRWQDSGKLRGYAHVTFESETGVAKALALNNEYLGDRFVTVSASRPIRTREPPPCTAPPGCTTLFVRNLPYEVDEAAIRPVFERFGTVASIRLPRRYDTQVSKGFCYVQYEGKSGAEGAVAASVKGLTMGGRNLQLDYDTSAGPKASFKGADGRAYSKTEGGIGGNAGGSGGGDRGSKRLKDKGKGKRVDAGVAAHND